MHLYTRERRGVKVQRMKHARRVQGPTRQYLRDKRGVSALEYAILVGIIAVAVAAALGTFSGAITKAVTDIGTQVKTAGSNAQAVDTNPTD